MGTNTVWGGCCCYSKKKKKNRTFSDGHVVVVVIIVLVAFVLCDSASLPGWCGVSVSRKGQNHPKKKKRKKRQKQHCSWILPSLLVHAPLFFRIYFFAHVAS